MIYCPNCRRENENSARFCRSCGNRLTELQTQLLNTDNQTAPRPYMWKTDEFQINQPTPKIQQLNQLPQVPSAYHQSVLTQNQQNYPMSFRCPRCGSQSPPYITRQISTAGWVTFAVLLVTTFIFFWIGLLIKEDVRVCPVCNYKYN